MDRESVGLGKTKAVKSLLLRLDSQLRPIEIVTIPEHATRLPLPQTILEYFGEQPKGNSVALTKQVVKFLDDNEIRVLILDKEEGK